jgi:hypothetical protein
MTESEKKVCILPVGLKGSAFITGEGSRAVLSAEQKIKPPRGRVTLNFATDGSGKLFVTLIAQKGNNEKVDTAVVVVQPQDWRLIPPKKR